MTDASKTCVYVNDNYVAQSVESESALRCVNHAVTYCNELPGLKSNIEPWRPVLAAADKLTVLPEGAGGTELNAYVGVVDADNERIRASSNR